MHSSIRRQWVISSAVVLTFAVLFLLFRVSPVHKINGWLTSPPSTAPSLAIYKDEPDHPGFFDWETRSAFDPVRVEDAEHKSVGDLCGSFPEHLLAEIQPVLKTGHGVLEARVRPQLQSMSACLTNLLIFSDTDEYYEGHDLIDILRDIPGPIAKTAEDLDAYRNGSLADGTASRRGGWRADKFKFLLTPMRAWKMRPGRKWYVFYEADTYIVWDNVFRMLANFDPNEPYYFGSPSPGRDGTWFANGGPGYILSRGAMRRLTQHDFDHKTGHYVGPALLRKWWKLLVEDCCGDSVLGYVLWHENVTLSGLWPMMSPAAPHMLPFSTLHWCQPVMTMHRPAEGDIIGLWRWQWEYRVVDRPLLYRDLATSYFNITGRRTREDWDSGARNTFDAPTPSEFYSHDPHASYDACDEACVAHDECFQWTYRLRKCSFVRIFRYGMYAEAGFDKQYAKAHPEESEDDWDSQDLKWWTGWDTVKIANWIAERPCDEVKWVRPSIRRYAEGKYD